MCCGFRLDVLPNGDVEGLANGDHVVLEASSGSLLHALRIDENRFFALRGGRVQIFQAHRQIPSDTYILISAYVYMPQV